LGKKDYLRGKSAFPHQRKANIQKEYLERKTKRKEREKKKKGEGRAHIKDAFLGAGE